METRRRDARPPTGTLRVATFNASLFREAAGGLAADLEREDDGGDPQARAVAEVVQRTAPDILLVNEFDYDERHRAAALFRDRYLAVGQGRQSGLDYPHFFTAPSNTGVPSGLDLDGDGAADGPGDALGFGEFPGQYGMAVYSRLPLGPVRTFRDFRWADMPGHLMPEGFYPPEAAAVLPLPSKSFWDVPVRTAGRTLHLLASHPAPPAFDGPERRNARRNHDEVRLLDDYVSGAGYLLDDGGVRGGLAAGESFVVLGDLNADPHDTGFHAAAIRRLLRNPRVADPWPLMRIAAASGGATGPQGRACTADFGEDGPGRVRVDYALPSRDLDVAGTGVFWPAPGTDGADLVAGPPFATSDHRLVWVDLRP